MSRTGVFSYINIARELDQSDMRWLMTTLANAVMEQQVDELLQRDIEFLMSMPVETFLPWARRRAPDRGSCSQCTPAARPE